MLHLERVEKEGVGGGGETGSCRKRFTSLISPFLFGCSPLAFGPLAIESFRASSAF